MQSAYLRNGENGNLDFSLMDFENVQVFRSDPKLGSCGLSVVEFGKQRVSAHITDRKLKVFAVVLVEKGCGTLTTQHGGRQIVRGPALFWLFPNQTHSYGPDAHTTWLERWALFRGAMIDQFEAGGLISRNQPLVPLENLAEITRTFGTLHSEMLCRDALGWAAAAASLHRLVVQAASQAKTAHAGESESQSPEIDALIQASAFEGLDLTGLARSLRMSPATLRRKCIAAHGVPPKQYQLQLRIDRAKELLAMTNASVEDLAAAVGYEDAFYFSRLFFKRERRSPSEFRKLHARN